MARSPATGWSTLATSIASSFRARRARYLLLVLLLCFPLTLITVLRKSPRFGDSTDLVTTICREALTWKKSGEDVPFQSKVQLASEGACRARQGQYYDGECIEQEQIGHVYYDPCNPRGQRIFTEAFKHFNGRDHAWGPGIGGLERHRFYCKMFPMLIKPILHAKIKKTVMFDDSKPSFHYAQSRITNPIRVLAFGPQMEEGNARTFENVAFDALGYPVDYIMADLDPEIQTKYGAYAVDAQNTGFPSDFFHGIQFSHILEHVESMEASLAELSRILAPGGFIILSCPISMNRETTLEDPSCTTKECRLEKFNQEDHVRVVGRDLIELIKKYFAQVHHGRIYEWFSRRHPELGRLFKNPEYTEVSKELFIIAIKGGGVPGASNIF